jgi:hypothetical protein
MPSPTGAWAKIRQHSGPEFMDKAISLPPLPPGAVLDKQPWLKDPLVHPDTSFTGALQQGAHDALSGLGSTVSLLGKDVGSNAAQGVGKWLQGAVPQDPNYQSAGGDLVSHLKGGRLLAAVKDLPRAAVEGAPAVAGGLAAAAGGVALAPEALAGAAGLGGAALYGAASNFGSNAAARAAANNHATSTTGDQLVAGGTATAQGLLGAVGLGKVPGVGPLLGKLGASKFLANGALDAAGAGAANVTGQVGNTLGTTQGLTVDPAEAEAAAAQALAARGGGTLAGQLGGGIKAGTSATGDAIARSSLPEMTDTQAASYTRLNNMMPAATAAAAQMRGGVSPTNLLNSIHKQLAPQVRSVIQAARDSGAVDPSDYATVLMPAFNQAAVHKSVITNMDQVNALNIAPQLKTAIVNGLTDLDSASPMMNYKQAKGPFATIGAALARTAAIGGSIALIPHAPLEGIAALAGAALNGSSHGSIATLGNSIGGAMDRFAGTAKTPNVLLASQALKQATSAGYPTDVNTGSDLQDAYNLMSRQSQPPAPPTPMELATKQAQTKAFSALSTLGPDHPTGQAAIQMLPQPLADQALSVFQQTQGLGDGTAKAKAGQQFDNAYQQADAQDFQRDQAIQARGIALNEAAANQLSGQQYKNSEDGVVGRAKMAAQRKEWIAQAQADGRIPTPMTQDQRDRIMIGLPPTDPTPVNTPLDASGRVIQAPVSQTASGVAPSAPQASTGSVVTPVAAPASTTQTPNVMASPQGSQSVVAPPPTAQTGNWQDYLRSQLLGHGIAAGPDTVATALANLLAQGKIAADHAAALGAYTGDIGETTPAYQAVFQQAHLDHGMAPPPATLPPIRDLARWQTAAGNYQQLAATLQTEAANEGDAVLARAIARIRAVSSVSQKQ